MAFVNQPKQHTYDLVLVGSSFASGFFLYEYLKTAPENASILVLERGNRNPHQWQLENQKNSDIDWFNTYIHEGLSHKDWMFTIGFGGSSNCWTGCCP
ncbi:MAG TPA: GMC family oxidoreductase, partial [Gammaproteobacteria bacterium]|nr:GMC family oxidoreductase [Gammaproteobacteria bacterium]